MAGAHRRTGRWRRAGRRWGGIGAGALALLVATATATATASVATGSAGAATRRAGSAIVRAALPAGAITHVFVIEMENEGYAATFGPSSPATYLTHTLAKKGEILANYYATGHVSLDNYISQVSGQAPTTETQSDCLGNNAAFVDVSPGTPAPDQVTDPGQVVGHGCVYPSSVQTIANQLDARYPPNPRTHVASWRAYEQDMGNTPARDGGTPDPSGGTDCAHPAIGGTAAVVGTPEDQYVTRHDPFVWFHSIIDDTALCDANVVPLGTLGSNGKPAAGGHLAKDLRSASTTPRFAFITPNVCNDGHDLTCAGTNSAGGHTGGLVGINLFLQHWMPLILGSPAYRSGKMLVVITFDEADINPTANPAYAAACCNESSGPNTTAPGSAGATSDAQAPGGGRVGALLLNARYIRPGSVDRSYAYNHYSALRSYEDLLGLTTGGADGHGHLGFAAAPGLRPFGRDVFNRSG